jgi:transposase InsO family protein
LKQEYALGGVFRSRAEGKKAVDEAVYLFNTKRPRLALKYKTPRAAYSLPSVA